MFTRLIYAIYLFIYTYILILSVLMCEKQRSLAQTVFLFRVLLPYSNRPTDRSL